MPDAATVVGTSASILTSVSLLPQLVKIIRERAASGTSPWMLGCLFFGLSLWIAYGALRHDVIVVVANAFSLAVNICVIALSMRYSRRMR